MLQYLYVLVNDDCNETRHLARYINQNIYTTVLLMRY